MDCDRGQFITKDSVQAIDASLAQIRGDVNLTEVTANGVDFTDSKIDGNVNCRHSQFSTGAAPAFNVNGANIRGSVFFGEGFNADGGVDLTNAYIGDYLVLLC